MQIHQLKKINKDKKSKRIGRGGKRGTYSGRGVKGYYSRSGSKKSPGFIGGGTRLFKRLPKRRGQGVASLRVKPTTVNLSLIDKKYKAGETVSPASLFSKRLIRKVAGRLPKIKILSDGELGKKLIFSQCLFSKSAEDKIKKSGSVINNNK